MFAKSVSPPVSGTVCNRSREPIGGRGSHDTSECHCSPATRREFLVGVDRHDFGVAIDAGVVGVRDQLAEARPKLLLALDRNVLVAEEDHAVVHQRVVDQLEVGVTDIVEVEAVDFGTDRRV